MKTIIIEEGTIIHATMITQDLIPAFLDELNRVNPMGYAQMMVNNAMPPSYAMDDDEDEWWDDEAYSYLEMLFDALDEESPEGFYFGAHPGDGSDYGYWKTEDEV